MSALCHCGDCVAPSESSEDEAPNKTLNTLSTLGDDEPVYPPAYFGGEDSDGEEDNDEHNVGTQLLVAYNLSGSLVHEIFIEDIVAREEELFCDLSYEFSTALSMETHVEEEPKADLAACIDDLREKFIEFNLKRSQGDTATMLVFGAARCGYGCSSCPDCDRYHCPDCDNDHVWFLDNLVDDHPSIFKYTLDQSSELKLRCCEKVRIQVRAKQHKTAERRKAKAEIKRQYREARERAERLEREDKEKEQERKWYDERDRKMIDQERQIAAKQRAAEACQKAAQRFENGLKLREQALKVRKRELAELSLRESESEKMVKNMRLWTDKLIQRELEVQLKEAALQKLQTSGQGTDAQQTDDDRLDQYLQMQEIDEAGIPPSPFAVFINPKRERTEDYLEAAEEQQRRNEEMRRNFAKQFDNAGPAASASTSCSSSRSRWGKKGTVQIVIDNSK